MLDVQANRGVNGDMKVELNRLDATVLFILNAAQKKKIDNLSRFEIMKLVYLIEVESMKFMGRKFTDDVTFVRDTNGPISYDIYRSTEKLEQAGLIEIEAMEGNPEYGYSRSCHRLKKALPKLPFEKSEMLYLNSVLSDYLGLTIRKLKDLTYKTEPMREVLAEEKHSGIKTLKGKKIDFDTIALDEDILVGMMS